MSNGHWRCGPTTCHVTKKTYVGNHVTADLQDLPRNASENECAWFAWVRGTTAGIVGEAEGAAPVVINLLGFDEDEREFVSNLFFYVAGAVCALAIPLVAYACATILFSMTERVLNFEEEDNKRARPPARAARLAPCCAPPRRPNAAAQTGSRGGAARGCRSAGAGLLSHEG